MRRYYTLEDATDKAYKDKKLFVREKDTSFCRDTQNLIRMFFGFEPKFYYFTKSPNRKEFQRYEKRLAEERLKHQSLEYNIEEYK